MDRRFDPRSIVTPYAFAVHPDLLGRPLATPWQRLGAILVDLIVIGFISQIGVAPLAVASTGLLFWLAFRKPGGDVLGKFFRFAVGCLGFLILSITLLVVLWMRYGEDIQRGLEESGSSIRINSTGALEGDPVESQPEAGGVGLLDIVQGFRGVAALQGAETQEEAQALMRDFAQGAADAGLPRNQIRELLAGVVPQDLPWASFAEGMIDEAVSSINPAEAGAPNAPTSEPEVGQEDRSVTMSPMAMDSIDRLNRAIQSAEEDRADAEAALEGTQRRLDEEQNQGAFDWLLGFIDDLGIGFGWAALYLTITHAWWRGTSIGKKLFRIRVVMIDKRPLNWWLSFERAGGYAAGLATGLLGFAQVFWDPNRQAIHDKVSETFVIQDGKDPVPGPWMEEGNAQWNKGRHGAGNTEGGDGDLT